MLTSHNLPWQLLGARLAFAKPNDPNAFLKGELIEIQRKQAANEPVTLFSEEDMNNMFSIFDITGRGYVNHVQYDKGMLNRLMIAGGTSALS